MKTVDFKLIHEFESKEMLLMEGSPVANFPREIELPENFEKPFGLDKNTAFLISRYLGDKDLINICQSSKGFHGIFYTSLEKRLISLFLSYVIEGRLDKVKGILNKPSKLALAHGDVTDLSGRHFQNITGFQYAVWAGDERLWKLILKYLPENDAYDQLVALINERPDVTKAHGAPLSFFDALVNAYRRYMDNYNKWDESKREACWQKEVGGAQRNMPAWFITVFSEEGTNKAWPTQEMTRLFSRKSEHIKTWFEAGYNNGKCGSTFAFYRGALPGGRVPVLTATALQSDFENSASLKAERTKKLAVLTERLERAAKSMSNSQLTISNRK